VTVVALRDLCVKSAAASSRLVSCGGVEQVKTRRDLELGVVVGEGIAAVVVGAHQLLHLLQLAHAGQVAAEDFCAGAV